MISNFRGRILRICRRSTRARSNHTISAILQYMLLAELVETSRKVAATSKRLEKTDLLARLVRELGPEEVDIAVPMLAGEIRQGRIGIGYATVRDSRGPAAPAASLSLADVDRAFQSIIDTLGSGSQRQRLELLHQLFARATEAEHQFLIALLMGELRQGALEAVMIEALAKASGAAVERVRRAVMLAGGVAKVAGAVLKHGEAALAQYDVQLFCSVQPMLAGSAEGVDEAL